MRSSKYSKHRVLSIVLSLMMVLSCVPSLAFVEETSAATTHSHPVCGSTCKCTSTTHSSNTWKAWDGTTSLATGYYYLTKDVELTSTKILSNGYTTQLCLNGHKITCDGKVFDIYSNNTLVITDCIGTGTIECTGSGPAIGNNRQLNIWGGTILCSGSWDAIEAYVGTGTYIYGGTIEAVDGSAIYAYQGSTINVKGGTLIGGGYSPAIGSQAGSQGTSKLTISGGTFMSNGSETLDIQSGDFTMSGGRVEGNVTIYDTEGVTNVSGGTVTGVLQTDSGTVTITGGSMVLNTTGNTTISTGKFTGTSYICGESNTMTGGDFSLSDTLWLRGKTQISGGIYDYIQTENYPVYLSGTPKIETLNVGYPDTVSAQSEDGTGSYAGNNIKVTLYHPYAATEWEAGDVVIKNVESDAIAEKFVLSGQGTEWKYLERVDNNLVLRTVPHGTWEGNVTWEIRNGVLTISGNGDIYETFRGQYPWSGNSENVTKIVVESGITDIPPYAFENFVNLTTISLPETIQDINLKAFFSCKSLNNLLIPSSVTYINGPTDENEPSYFEGCESLTDLYYFGTVEEWASNVMNSYRIDSADSEMTKHFLVKNEKPATCTEPGKQTYYQFDDTSIYKDMYDADRNVITEVGTVPAPGHTEVIDEAVEATCRADGLTEGSHCSVCGEVFTVQAVIPSSGHKYDNNCDGDCNVCGEERSIQHDYEWVIDEEATCIESGIKHEECTTCHVKRNENTVITTTGQHTYDNECDADCNACEYVRMTTHDYDSVVTEPTCTKEGFTTHTCSVCGDSYRDRETAKLGHTVVIDEAVAATCTEDGVTEGTHCSVCDKVFVAQEVIEAKGHKEVIDPAEEPTCIKDGATEGSHCSVCDEVLVAQDVIKAEGHKLQLMPEKKATCTEDGYTMGIKCTVCEDILLPQIPIVSLGEHTVIIDEAVEPTCMKDGLTEGSHCSVCGEVFEEQETVEAEGHALQLIPEKKMTCTEDGYTAGLKCTACETVLIPQMQIVSPGHTEVIDEAVAATCTEAGLTEGKHCLTCKEVLVAQEEIDASGHALQVIPSVKATCTEEGLTDGVKCTVCETVLIPQVKTPALGHKEVIDPAVEPTCTEEGLTEGKHCRTCDEVLVAQEKIEVKAHEYEADVTEPTCTESGFTIHTCRACGDSYKDTETAKLGHKEVMDPAVEATCAKAGRTEGSHCEVCDEIIVKQEIIDRPEHVYEVIKGKDYTCTEDGLTAGVVCTVCNKAVLPQLVIPAPGHVEVKDEAVKASFEQEGITEGVYCTTCQEVLVEPKVIPALAVPALSGTGYAYNGKAKSPKVTVTDINGNIAVDSNGNAIKYTYKYETKRINVGYHAVTVNIKDNDYYEGTYQVSFTINPAGVSISKLTAASKAFTVKWKKPSAANRKQMTGYQIRYSTSSGMANAKTVTVKSTTAVSKKISKLSAKKYYYVQLRTYKGDRYSKWSTAKRVKTK